MTECFPAQEHHTFSHTSTRSLWCSSVAEGLAIYVCMSWPTERRLIWGMASTSLECLLSTWHGLLLLSLYSKGSIATFYKLECVWSSFGKKLTHSTPSWKRGQGAGNDLHIMHFGYFTLFPSSWNDAGYWLAVQSCCISHPMPPYVFNAQHFQKLGSAFLRRYCEMNLWISSRKGDRAFWGLSVEGMEKSGVPAGLVDGHTQYLSRFKLLHFLETLLSFPDLLAQAVPWFLQQGGQKPQKSYLIRRYNPPMEIKTVFPSPGFPSSKQCSNVVQYFIFNAYDRLFSRMRKNEAWLDQ